MPEVASVTSETMKMGCVLQTGGREDFQTALRLVLLKNVALKPYRPAKRHRFDSALPGFAVPGCGPGVHPTAMVMCVDLSLIIRAALAALVIYPRHQVLQTGHPMPCSRVGSTALTEAALSRQDRMSSGTDGAGFQRGLWAGGDRHRDYLAAWTQTALPWRPFRVNEFREELAVRHGFEP